MWWILATTLSGYAQDPASDSARALYDQGLRYYQQRDYATAIQLWEKSYTISPLPAILHNIAKAQEEANLPREALATWREYFAVAPPEGRPAAEERIVALEVVVAALGDIEAPPPPAPVPAPVPVEPEPPRERRSSRGLWAGLLAAGATGGVVSGSVLAVQARTAASGIAREGCLTLDGSALCDDPTATALRAEQLRFVLGAGLVGAGIALGGGTVWVAVRPSPADTSVVLEGRW